MLAEQARELGMDGLWQDAIKALRNAFDRTATKAGITFSQPGLRCLESRRPTTSMFSPLIQ